MRPYNQRRDARGRNPYGNNIPVVPYHHSSFDVIHSLRSQAAMSSPAYAFAVLKNYCDLKYARGKNKAEIDEKLMYLEHELRWRSPVFERCFDEIREYFLLRPSPLRNTPSAVADARRQSYLPARETDSLRRVNTYGGPRPPPPTHATQAQISRPAVTRAADEPGDEPPPPPYSASDPEPEATAVLMAVQQAEGNSSAAPSIAGSHRRAQSDVGSTVSSTMGDSPRPNAFPASPAARVGSLSVPNGNRRTSNASTTPPPERPRTPLNPEEERIREESELEEAMRLSRLSEKERLEYERAIQASLATLEEDTSMRRIAEEAFPGESPAGPSSRPSSYQPTASTPAYQAAGSSSQGMQRAASASYAQHPTDMHAPSPAAPSGPSGSSGYAPPQNLLDALESLDFSSAPPLTPAKPVTAQRTGQPMQSNNPFLSDVERGERLWDSDSSPTSSERELPPLPAEAHQEHPQYAAPDHPPPGWVPDRSDADQNVAHAQYDAPPVPPPPKRTPSAPSPHRSPGMTAQNHASHPMPPPLMTSGLNAHQAYLSPQPLSPDVPLSAHAQQRPASPAPFLIGGENALEMLREFDTVFLIDDSTSMKGERWETAITAIMGVVQQAVQYDEDGIDVYFLNSKRVGKGLRTADDVAELFAGLEPKGATPTGLRMEAILREYMARLERATADGDTVRSMNLIVVTDGAFAVPVIHRIRRATCLDDRLEMLESAPTDDPESVLISIARRLDRGDYPLSQVGVQLLQIGDDPEAKEALHELDEGMSSAHGVRDMVDTVPYNGEPMTANLIVKVLLGGINRRIDRNRFNRSYLA